MKDCALKSDLEDFKLESRTIRLEYFMGSFGRLVETRLEEGKTELGS